MRISPRYEGEPAINVDAVFGDPYAGLVRQRSRLADALGALTPDQWSTPSRCEGWSIQDVVAHLVGVNQFWVVSITGGLRGEPTRFLATFDPVAVPAQMVDAARGAAPDETLAAFVESNAQLAATMASLASDDWSTRAEAPAGHIALRAVASHALWDSWIHERDVLIPLGRDQDVEPDEALVCLAFAAALGPGLRAAAGSQREGILGVVAHDPAIELTVDIGSVVSVRPGGSDHPTATIEGAAVELIEALSFRGPAPTIVEEHRWLIGGLDEVFDLAESP